MKALTKEQVAAWRRDGFLFPFPCLTEGERQDCLAGLARFEAWLGAPVNASKDLSYRTMPHLLLPWVMRLATDARILDKVEDLLGPDLMIWTSTFFIKEPNSPTISAWHQDSTYYGLEPVEEITVWVALTEASHAAGCMDAVSYRGEPRQMQHIANAVENSVNRAGQVISEPFDDSDPVTMQLRAGEFSMHHGLCPHRSGPNSAGHRRIGLGLNFIPASARPTGAHRTAAILVRGEDRFGNFMPVSPPRAEFDADALANHRRAVAAYGATYREQEELHLRRYG
ncbi:phytanoyl-CoA dioxygenase family protein [Roseomonas sp. NAR14]|uniref:Phytanoyl-CoA dioxygenase family protein n=1 Tax=Roseomonas acroporae TaxID=2937791 RepID=A0A9X2BUF2_9PROT|nr:phytanoyl-CoA dioxygenase family protein [Roseomonas acroporae]MCK8784001.1 phytanoyl-CoA dioxygenase family protein [Roseomonas acroporae]